MNLLKNVLRGSSIFLLACSGLAQAQLRAPTPPAQEAADWRVSYGAALVAGPRYPGASSSRAMLVPSIDARYKDFFFFNPVRGIGLETRLADGLTGSAALAYDFTSRREKDDSRLRGLGDIGSTAALSFELNYRASDVFFNAGLRSRLGDEKGRGSVLDTDVGYSFLQTPASVLSAGLNLRSMDGTYARNFFGVNAQQSAASKLPVFQARSGLQSAGVFGQAFYRVDSDWSIFGRLNLYSLQSDAAASPVTQQKNQIGLVLSVSRAF